MKREFINNYETITGEEDNRFYLLLLSDLLINNDERSINYINKHYLNKIRKSYLYSFYIQHACNMLLQNNSEYLEKSLDFFIKSGLALSSDIVSKNNHDTISLTLSNGDKINFSNIPLSQKLIDEYRRNCHAVTSYWMRLSHKDQYTSVVLEPNQIYGGFYHSFVVENNTMLDFSHNIMMNYDSYLKLVKPRILVHENSKNLLLF